MKAILVPTDFSTSSRKALEIAAWLAVQSRAELVLLNVDERAGYVAQRDEFEKDDRRTVSGNLMLTQEFINEMRSDLVRHPAFSHLQVRTVLQPGALVPVVEAFADKNNIDLVVMGTLGASGLEELLIGSNTEKVIRRVCCPVLAVPQEARSGETRTIVFPTTLKDDQKVVFRRLAAFQKTLATDVSVQVLYINDPAGLKNEAAIEKRYKDLVEDSQLKNTTFHLKGALDLDEGVEILQFSKEQEADIITMGTHQRRGLSHLLFGSMTENTVNHSEIPVLTIPIR